MFNQRRNRNLDRRYPNISVREMNSIARSAQRNIITGNSMVGIMGHLQRPSALSSGGAIRLAFCKTDAPNSNVITCYLDADSSGEEIEVTCLIHNSTRLDYAIPYLSDGDPIFVVQIDNVWYSWPYQGVKDYSA